MSNAKPKGKPGPKAERLLLSGDWEKLVGEALTKKRPESGWPAAKSKKKAGKK